jgi:hypothetical protein
MITRSPWLRLLAVVGALALVTGCGSEGTVTPAPADQTPTSDEPVGPEPTLPGDDEGADANPDGGEPFIDGR